MNFLDMSEVDVAAVQHQIKRNKKTVVREGGVGVVCKEDSENILWHNMKPFHKKKTQKSILIKMYQLIYVNLLIIGRE